MRFNLLPDRDGYNVVYSNQCIKETLLDGGVSAKRLDFTDVTYIVDCQFTLTKSKYEYFKTFTATYYAGPVWFDILLVIEPYIPLYPIRNYKAQIVPGTDRLTRVNGNTFTVAMQLECYLDDLPLTSQPYPLDQHETMLIGATPTAASMKIDNHIYNEPNENTAISMSVISAELRVLLRGYANWPNENVGVSMSAISAELRSLLRSYANWTNENTAISMTVISADLAVKLRTYANWPVENIGISMTVISGSLI